MFENSAKNDRGHRNSRPNPLLGGLFRGRLRISIRKVATGFPADPLMAAPTIFLRDHRRCQRPNRTLLQRQSLPSKRDKMLSRTFMVAFVQTFAEERSIINLSEVRSTSRTSEHQGTFDTNVLDLAGVC